jgi:tetratricopeptide (TPR) repeat protein
MRTVVLDTNVLLSEPGVLLSFTDAEVVIPETVLGELDKLKTSRVDPDLRFRGREVSRILFELSEHGSLVTGVELPDGGRLRVLPIDSESAFPEELSPKNADDRILAVAMQLRDGGEPDVTLLTNDLNMLLKAQTLGVRVQRHFEGVDGGWAKRWIIRPFQRYRVPLSILATSIAVFAAIVFLSVWGPLASRQAPQNSAVIPQEFKDQLIDYQQKILDYLLTLQRNPNDTQTELNLANVYFNLATQGGHAQYASLAIQHYTHVLESQPDNLDARTDMAVMEFTSGETDKAIQDSILVLRKNPSHMQANFNLGVFYWQGRKDYKAAAGQFTKVIDLTRGDNSTAAQAALKDAETKLAAVQKEAAGGGKPSTSTTTTGGFK